MVRFPGTRLIQIPAAGGAAAAFVTALFFLVLPDWRLEGAVAGSGLPELLPFAQPPLGTTARALLMVAGAAIAGAVGWATLFLVWGPGGVLHRAQAAGDAPSVRRADAHPDAPPRRPLSAADLGVPPPPAERPIPADLDQPLAAFHPAAIPAVPLAPTRAIAPPVPLPVPAAEADAGEAVRIETFELTPMVRGAPRAAPAPAETPTVEALIRRLEAGTRRRAARAD